MIALPNREGMIAQFTAAGDAAWPEGTEVTADQERMAEMWWYRAGRLRTWRPGIDDAPEQLDEGENAEP